MLIATTVIACVLGWGMYEYRYFERERQAVKVLSRQRQNATGLGTTCTRFDPPSFRGPTKVSPEPVLDLTELSRGSIYRPIEHAYLFGGPFNDETAQALNSFRHLTSLRIITGPWMISQSVFEANPKLERLDVANCQLRERDVDAIANLPNLKELSLSGDKMPAGSATRVSRMQLKQLMLGQMAITDAAMVNISRMSSLSTLDLSWCQFSSDSTLGLGQLQRLEFLSLSLTTVDDRLFVQSTFPRLETLKLGDTKVTDEGVKGIVRNQGIVHLNLRKKQITDEGVKELIKLPKLVTLDLSETKITKQSLETLKAIPTLNFAEVVTDFSPN
jgi:Leucine-rich repeat (LRR) protein